MDCVFERAPKIIGRRRLPAGLIAVLNNAAMLRAAIEELHTYANGNREAGRPRRGLVFRVVEAWEQEAFVQKLHNLYGSKHPWCREGKFFIPLGHLHIIDDSLMSHACNRHAITEGTHPHLILSIDDFRRIPEVVNPRNIVEFAFEKGMPRVIYEKAYEQKVLVVVQEIQASAGLAVRTAYKKREGRGGHPAG